MSKIGAGHLNAMGRLGVRELRNAANPSRESIADTELGLYGSLTPGEISETRQGERSMYDHGQERAPQSPELER